MICFAGDMLVFHDSEVQHLHKYGSEKEHEGPDEVLKKSWIFIINFL